MVKIILSRIGKTKHAQYRLIAVDKQKDPWGKCLELLGFYDPHTKATQIKVERVKHWIGLGAQPSVTVHNLLIKNGTIEGKKKRASKITKRRAEKATAKAAAAAKA
jgi:small subunit ribosomal protein S16